MDNTQMDPSVQPADDTVVADETEEEVVADEAMDTEEAGASDESAEIAE